MKEHVKITRRFLLIGLALLLILLGAALIFFGFRLQWKENQVQKDLKNLYFSQLSFGGEDSLNLPPGIDSNGETELPGHGKPPLPAPEEPILPGDDEDPDVVFDFSKLKPIALLSIPKIKLDVVVVEGTKSSDLLYAVGHFEGSAMPGEKGNVAIAGHRTFVSGQFFKKLDELGIGDTIELEYEGKKIVYRVTETMIVLPDETWVIGPTAEPMITLVTCTPPRSTSHRLIIRGALVG